MNTDKLLTELHTEHTEWLNNLAFYKAEIQTLQKRLAEVVSKNTDDSILATAEHFQNQLIVHNNEMEVLEHDIRSHERYIESHVTKAGEGAEFAKGIDHSAHRDKVERFEKLLKDLRSELNKFLSKVL